MAGVRAGQVQGADAAVDEQQAMPAGLRRDAEHGTGAATDQAPLRGRPAAGSDPDRAAVLPFTAIRSSFGASVRPSGPFSSLTGEERRSCGQRPHRCRGIWRPPGRAFPVPGKKRTTTGARMPYAPSSRGPAGSTAGHLDRAVPLAGNPVLLPGGVAAELGRGRAGRSEAACRLGQTEIVEATAACSGFARCSCGLRRPVQRRAGCAFSAAGRGFGSLRPRLWSLYIEETVTHSAVTVFLVSGRAGRLWAGNCGWGRGPAGLPDHGRAAKIRSGLWPGSRASATPAARMV